MPIGNKTLLCIDRDPSALWIQRRFLRENGYEVVTATNGLDGLSVLKVVGVDAIVLRPCQDLLDSLLVAVAMKQVRPQVRIVMVSDNVELPEGIFEVVDARVSDRPSKTDHSRNGREFLHDGSAGQLGRDELFELLDGIPFVLGSGMHVAHRHLNLRMSGEFLQGSEVDA